MPDTDVILGARKLSGENSHSGHRAKNTQVEYKKQLVHNGHTAHLSRSHLPHHDVIQHTYKIGNGVLNHDGHRHSHHRGIKLPISNIFLQHNILNVIKILGSPTRSGQKHLVPSFT